MKRTRMILFAIAALFLLALPGALISSGSVTKAGEPFPCDPTPTMVRKCELRGGTFDYGQCKCVFP